MGHGVYEQLSRKNPERERELGTLIRRGYQRGSDLQRKRPLVCLSARLPQGWTHLPIPLSPAPSLASKKAKGTPGPAINICSKCE